MAAPDKVINILDDACPNRIVMDIAKYLQQITIFIHHHSLEAPSKQLAVFFVRAVKTLRVDAIDMTHAA